MSALLELEGSPFLWRTMDNEDVDFIASSWVQSHAANSRYLRQMGTENYYAWHVPRIGPTLLQPTQTTFVAVVRDEPGAIVAYVTGKRDVGVVDYLYVKSAARKMGLGNALLQRFGAKRRSHETMHTNEFFKKRNVTFDPYAFGVLYGCD